MRSGNLLALEGGAVPSIQACLIGGHYGPLEMSFCLLQLKHPWLKRMTCNEEEASCWQSLVDLRETGLEL